MGEKKLSGGHNDSLKINIDSVMACNKIWFALQKKTFNAIQLN